MFDYQRLLFVAFATLEQAFTKKSVVKNRNPEFHEIAKIILGISAPYIYT